MGKLHKIRRVWAQLSDEQKAGGLGIRGAWLSPRAPHGVGFGWSNSYRNYIAKLRRHYMAGVAHSDESPAKG